MLGKSQRNADKYAAYRYISTSQAASLLSPQTLVVGHRLRFFAGTAMLLESDELIVQLEQMLDQVQQRAEEEARRREEETRLREKAEQEVARLREELERLKR